MTARLGIVVCSLLSSCYLPPALPDGGCTSGFMSFDRIDSLQNANPVDVVDNYQIIFPEIGFTCSGNILGLEFGGVPVIGSELPEIQIWRPGGREGAFSKIQSTSIIAEGVFPAFYKYTLSSPLPFNAGNVLGYYQPFHSSLRLNYERDGTGNTIAFLYSGLSSPTDLYLPWGIKEEGYQLLLSIVTDSPNCVQGFMSVERIRLLLQPDIVSMISLFHADNRQQISPQMKFTCDGLITKWIVGGVWSGSLGNTLYPELQVWRNIANNTYQKISGTYIFSAEQQQRSIYEYTSFSPIPVKSGDILGIFAPEDLSSRIRLRSERNSDSPMQYYISTSNSIISPYDVIDLEESTLQVKTSLYHPLVSVEIVSSTPSLPRHHTSDVKGVAMTSSIRTTSIADEGSSFSPFPQPPQQSTNDGLAFIGFTVALLLTTLLSLTFFIITLTLIIRGRRKMKLSLTATEGGRDSTELRGKGVPHGVTESTDDRVDTEENYDSIFSGNGSSAPNNMVANQAYGLLQSVKQTTDQ